MQRLLRTFLAACLVWCLALSPAHAERRRPLVERGTVTLSDPAAMPPGANVLHDAILRGARARGWQPTEDVPGRLVLRIEPRGKHVAVVAVRHDDRSFRVEYVSSVNLLYKERRDIAYIHRNYNVWVDQLIEAILLETNRPAAPVESAS